MENTNLGLGTNDTYNYPPLKQAPIREAIIEVLFELPPEIEFSDIASFENEISEKFPASETIKRVQGTIPHDNKIKPNLSSKDYGLIYFTEDRVKSLQTRVNGISYSVSKMNYPGWDIFFNDAKHYIQLFLRKFNITIVSRASLRYINIMFIPFPFNSFTEFFNTRIEVAEGLPQTLSEMLIKLSIYDSDRDIYAIITKTFAPPDISGVNFLFDIDVQKQTDLKSQDFDQLWSVFSDLRQFKNEVFFKSITEKTKNLLT